MKLHVQSEITRAHNKYIPEKIGNDDPTITYQEFALYWILRSCASLVYIEIEDSYSDFKSDGWIDNQWLSTKASHYNKMETPLSWDKVFDY